MFAVKSTCYPSPYGFLKDEILNPRGTSYSTGAKTHHTVQRNTKKTKSRAVQCRAPVALFWGIKNTQTGFRNDTWSPLLTYCSNGFISTGTDTDSARAIMSRLEYMCGCRCLRHRHLVVYSYCSIGGESGGSGVGDLETKMANGRFRVRFTRLRSRET